MRTWLRSRGLSVLSYTGATEPGERLVVKFDGQLNPNRVGRNAGAIAVRDGQRVVARRELSLLVLP